MLKQHVALIAALLLTFSYIPSSSSFVTVSRSAAAFRLQGPFGSHRLLISKEGMIPPSPKSVNGNSNHSVYNKHERPNGETTETSPQRHFFTYIPRKATQIYSEYLSRLWKETSVASRRKVAKDKTMQSIRQIKNIFMGKEEYSDISKVSQINRQNLLDACDSILADSDKAEGVKESILEAENITDAVAAIAEAAREESLEKNKEERSVLFGAAMGAVVAAWVFSGNWIFTGLFTAMTILGQLEYYRMVMSTGVYPARRVSVIGAASMFLTVRLYFGIDPPRPHEKLQLIIFHCI